MGIGVQVCLISPSKMSSPAGFSIRMKSNKNRAFIHNLPDNPYKIEDFLNKLYLSIQ